MENLIKEIFSNDPSLVYSELLEVQYNALYKNDEREVFISSLLNFYKSVEIYKKKHIVYFLNLVNISEKIVTFLRKITSDLELSGNEMIMPDLIRLASKIDENWAEEFILDVIRYSEGIKNKQINKTGYRALISLAKWEKHKSLILKHMSVLNEKELIDLLAYSYYILGEAKWEVKFSEIFNFLQIGKNKNALIDQIQIRFSEAYSKLKD